MSKGKTKEVTFSLSPFPGAVHGEQPHFLWVSAAPPLFIFSHSRPLERSHAAGTPLTPLAVPGPCSSPPLPPWSYPSHPGQLWVLSPCAESRDLERWVWVQVLLLTCSGRAWTSHQPSFPFHFPKDTGWCLRSLPIQSLRIWGSYPRHSQTSGLSARPRLRPQGQLRVLRNLKKGSQGQPGAEWWPPARESAGCAPPGSAPGLNGGSWGFPVLSPSHSILPGLAPHHWQGAPLQ